MLIFEIFFIRHFCLVWKNIPNDEHWLTFNIEMMNVEEWTVERQFQFLDLNNDSYITQDDVSLVFTFEDFEMFFLI